MLCLQGGAEFGAGCREMDAALLVRAEGGPVVITALAGAPGREYRTAGENGVRHFTALGAADVRIAPDVREDPDGAVAALRQARLLVLPGGSPSRLLEALRSTPVGDLVAAHLVGGGVVSGSSAGAMVLCAWTVLPERGEPSVVPALGLVPRTLVVPHWRGSSGWLAPVQAAVPDDVRVIGLPEQSGVVVEGGTVTAVGSAATALLSEDRELVVGDATALW